MRKLLRWLLLPCALCLLFLAAGCNVKFDYHIQFIVDGEKYAYVGTDKKDISMPKNPTKEHYTFDGWFWEDGDEFTLLSIADQPLTENNEYEVYARWKGIEYPFVYGYNEQLQGTVRYGEKISVDVPTRANYVFVGYYLGDEQITDENGNGLAPWYYTESKTLIAKWSEAPPEEQTPSDGKILLTFETNKSGSYASPYYIYAQHNQPIGTLPTVSEIDGYEFIGWYTEKEGKGTNLSPDTLCTFTQNVKIYGHWKAKTYTAYLDWGEGVGPASCTFTYGKPIQLPAPTTPPKGKELTAWYIPDSFGDWWDIGEDITVKKAGDVYLTANWDYASYTVTFIFNEECTNGLSSPYVMEDVHYDFYLSDDHPYLTKTGYAFQGWFTQPTGGEQVNLNGKWQYDKSLTLYPQWSEKTYTLSFFVPGYHGELPTFTYRYGDTVPDMPMDITVPGQKLAHWYDGTVVNVYYTPTTPMPAYDLTLEPLWEEYYPDEEKVNFTKLDGDVILRAYDFINDKLCALRSGGQVCVYDGTTSQKLHTFTQTGSYIDGWANRIAIVNGQTLSLYDLDSFALLKQITATSNIEAAKITDSAIIISDQTSLIFYTLDGTAYKAHEGMERGCLAINREDNVVYRLTGDDGLIGAYAIDTGELIQEISTLESYVPKEFYFSGYLNASYIRYDKTTLETLSFTDRLSDEFKSDDTASNAYNGHRALEILYEDDTYAVIYTYYWENQYGDYDDDFYYRTLRLFDKRTNTYVDEVIFQNKDYNDGYNSPYLQTVDYYDGRFFISNKNYAGVWTI